LSNVIAVFGGVYNNYLSLQATLIDARSAGADHCYCLGDLGGFGPHPNRVFAHLRDQADITVVQGNYDHSIGHELADCGCGYTDPRDNHFAQISYDYTLQNTDELHRKWLRELPTELRLSWGTTRVLMAHGSPRKTNEFLWESTSPDGFLDHLLKEAKIDLLFVTHTGIPWLRTLPDQRKVVNVGAIGRPANHGRHTVDYVLAHVSSTGVEIEFREVAYDFRRLAKEIRSENLPEEFAQTVESGWWTTCLEILPAKERSKSKF
jgi:diadenosine tetraphosphatase ApaH/serine/threonine PP2A family protein phosphatase